MFGIVTTVSLSLKVLFSSVLNSIWCLHSLRPIWLSLHFPESCQSHSVFHITFFYVLYTSLPSVVLVSLSLRSCLNQHHTLLFSTPMAWLMKRRGKTVSRWQTCSLTNQNTQHCCGVQLADSALYLVCRCKKRSLKRFVCRQTTIRALSLPQKVD